MYVHVTRGSSTEGTFVKICLQVWRVQMSVHHCVLDNEYTPESLIMRKTECEKLSM